MQCARPPALLAWDKTVQCPGSRIANDPSVEVYHSGKADCTPCKSTGIGPHTFGTCNEPWGGQPENHPLPARLRQDPHKVCGVLGRVR